MIRNKNRQSTKVDGKQQLAGEKDKTQTVEQGERQAPEWYNREDGIFGNLPVHYIASVLYALIALVPAVLYLKYGDGLKSWPSVKQLGLVWALIVSVAYPTWSWLEVRAFERWLREEGKDEATCKRERDYFKLMNDCARSFWTAVLAIYTLAGIWGLVLKA